MIQFFQRDDILVGGDLKNAIGGGIKNGFSGTHMFRAEFLDNLCAGRGFVANYLTTDSLLEFVHESSGKAMWIGWQGFLQDNAGHLPVTSGAIFARGSGGHTA